MFRTVKSAREFKNPSDNGKSKNSYILYESNNFQFSYHRPELVVKKLRYYARFIVVCLLLNKMDVVKDLVKVNIL